MLPGKEFKRISLLSTLPLARKAWRSLRSPEKNIATFRAIFGVFRSEAQAGKCVFTVSSVSNPVIYCRRLASVSDWLISALQQTEQRPKGWRRALLLFSEIKFTGVWCRSHPKPVDPMTGSHEAFRCFGEMFKAEKRLDAGFEVYGKVIWETLGSWKLLRSNHLEVLAGAGIPT